VTALRMVFFSAPTPHAGKEFDMIILALLGVRLLITKKIVIV